MAEGLTRGGLLHDNQEGKLYYHVVSTVKRAIRHKAHR